jgi:hypothetical protein
MFEPNDSCEWKDDLTSAEAGERFRSIFGRDMTPKERHEFRIYDGETKSPSKKARPNYLQPRRRA